MTVGTQLSRQSLDAAMEQLALSTFASVRQVQDLAAWSSTVQQADLEAAPYNYSTDEAYAIKAVIGWLSQGGTWLGGGPVPSDVHNVLADLGKFQGLGTAG